MKIDYNKTYKINYSEVDQNLKLSIYEAFNLAQDTVTEYYESFGGDNIVVKKNDNAVWVVSKAKLHINNLPSWRDIISGRSYTTMIKPIRTEVETRFVDKDNNIQFVSRQQSCVLDIETKKIRKIDTITYPKDMETEESIIQNDYHKLNDEFAENEFDSIVKIGSQDIDYSHHTNNAIYVRIIMNTLSCEFLDNNKLIDFEIHYLNESLEGECLKIYKKQIGNEIKFLIKNDEKEIIRANLEFISDK